MRVKINRDILIKGLEVIQNIISAKATLPILSNILIETQKDKIRLTATDLNIGISCVIPVNTLVEPGAITIPAKRFAGIIRELSDEDVEINTKKNNIVIIETKNCQFKIIGLPAEEFPKLPEFKDKEVIKIEQQLLKRMLAQTSFAVSLDEIKYILNGILFKITKDTITLIATDSKRLAVSQHKLTQEVTKEVSFIVPFKTLQELDRNLTDEGELCLIIGQNQALFDFKDVIIISRLIDGEFPDYRQVIPPVSEQKIVVDRQQFLFAIRRAALLATPDYQAVKLEVFKDKVVVSKSTPDVGESREEMACEYRGKEMVIGFNPSFITDVLKVLATDTIEFEVAGGEKPGVVRSQGYIYIVLPMRLS
jgi:DNA polymerase III subunit beta